MKIFKFLIAGIIAASPLSAAVIYVPSQYSNIQAGIDAASSGDTVLVADGTYTGSGNKNLDFQGVNRVLMSENGPADCIIDCEYSGRGFFFHSIETESSVIQGFTIINGYMLDGGGIYCEFSSPTIRNCIIADCQASGAGGGIRIIGFNPQIINCTIHNNYASTGGGLSVTMSDMILNSSILAANASSG